ncbi:hypothetical protein DPMN_084295 [Dreissena polymorpha]|uniref:Uncharacterized protein n=1 Tax=Dreissena polymorpha TaxID=45954 RepID=A0A9D4BJ45_DREPO|nr:hypothetical protein DPMN_084295 [Dreissena polymorpha]
MSEEDVIGSELSLLPPISAKLLKLADPCTAVARMDIHVSQIRQKLDKQEMPINLGCCVPGCALEGQDFPRLHAFRHHIQGIFDYRLPCNDASVVKGRVMALTQVATWLLRRPCILSDLVYRVNRQRVLAPLSGVRVSPDGRQGMVEICYYLSCHLSLNYLSCPLPTPLPC